MTAGTMPSDTGTRTPAPPPPSASSTKSWSRPRSVHGSGAWGSPTTPSPPGTACAPHPARDRRAAADAARSSAWTPAARWSRSAGSAYRAVAGGRSEVGSTNPPRSPLVMCWTSAMRSSRPSDCAQAFNSAGSWGGGGDAVMDATEPAIVQAARPRASVSRNSARPHRLSALWARSLPREPGLTESL